MDAAELEQVLYTAETLMCSFKWQRQIKVASVCCLHRLIAATATCMLACAGYSQYPCKCRCDLVFVVGAKVIAEYTKYLELLFFFQV